jgi:hypothetical protein
MGIEAVLQSVGDVSAFPWMETLVTDALLLELEPADVHDDLKREV